MDPNFAGILGGSEASLTLYDTQETQMTCPHSVARATTELTQRTHLGYRCLGYHPYPLVKQPETAQGSTQMGQVLRLSGWKAKNRCL